MRDARRMNRRSSPPIPDDLRARIEAARLDLLTLFRALDRMDLTPAEIPQPLWALDQPAGSLDLRAMLRDTLAALEQLSQAKARFRKNLPRRAHPALAEREATIRKSLKPSEAYSMVPGRDPQNG